jgi:DNA-binding transcriptional LysR family regulator
MAGPDWRLLETFVRVAESGSLTAAARRLGLSQPTASRYVQALEEQIGAKLFVRHSRGLGLTERGSELFRTARALDESVQEVFRKAAGLREVPRGTVRVSVNEPIGVEVLPPCFASLRYAYPEISLELVIDNAVANLSRREADVAIRMFRPDQLDLIAKRVGTVEIGLFGSRTYIQEHGQPDGLVDARAHTLIGSDRDASWLRAISALGLAPSDFAFRTDSLVAQIQAVLAGVGIGVLHLGIARKYSTLVRVLPDVAFEPLETWVVMHGDLRGNPPVRVVFDELCRFLQGYSLPPAAVSPSASR